MGRERPSPRGSDTGPGRRAVPAGGMGPTGGVGPQGRRAAGGPVTDLLRLPWDQVDEIADQMEHALPDEVVDAVEELLGSPSTCPHGYPIPDRKRARLRYNRFTTPERPSGRCNRHGHPWMSVCPNFWRTSRRSVSSPVRLYAWSAPMRSTRPWPCRLAVRLGSSGSLDRASPRRCASPSQGLIPGGHPGTVTEPGAGTGEGK